jgi:hypothetical protein
MVLYAIWRSKGDGVKPAQSTEREFRPKERHVRDNTPKNVLAGKELGRGG